MSRLNRFNWIARSYDKLVKLVFGQTLHQAQMHFVNEIGSTDNVLILGGGTGKFLESLLQTCPSIHVVYIEASSEMISLARAAVGVNPSVTFIHGTEENIPSAEFDVVITNFFLDLFDDAQIEILVRRVAKNLRPNGKWLVTEFEKTRKFSHRAMLALMYLFFHLTGSMDAKRLPMWKSVFKRRGLKLKAEKYFWNGFVSTNVYSKE